MVGSPLDASKAMPRAGRARRRLIDLVPYGVVLAGPDGAATLVNRAWTVLTGQTDPVWRGHGWLDVCATGDRESMRDDLLAAVRAGRDYEADWPASDGTDRQRTLHVEAVPELDHGRLARFVVAVVDVTADRARSTLLLDQATHDSLTGLFNRAQFLDFVGHALDRQRRAPESVAAVLFVDVDDLKAVNDALGHDAGDRTLLAVAARIKAAVRPADIVARYGGDEFAVLCEDLGHAVEAAAIADRIRGSADDDGSLSVSIGVAVASDPDTDPAGIIADADRAMYRAKRQKADAATSARPAAPAATTGVAVDRPLPRRGLRPGEWVGDGIDLRAVASAELQAPLPAIAEVAATLRAARDGMTPGEDDAVLALLDRQIG